MIFVIFIVYNCKICNNDLIDQIVSRIFKNLPDLHIDHRKTQDLLQITETSRMTTLNVGHFVGLTNQAGAFNDCTQHIPEINISIIIYLHSGFSRMKIVLICLHCKVFGLFNQQMFVVAIVVNNKKQEVIILDAKLGIHTDANEECEGKSHSTKNYKHYLLHFLKKN